jgi:uncharacterized protein (TIGR01777 family)
MKIIITGSSGLIGSALAAQLIGEGFTLTCLLRGAKKEHPAFSSASVVRWDVERGAIENPAQLEAHDAVIHLAGENVADGRWTSEKKRRIRDSRVRGTRLLVETLARLQEPPRIFLSASAVGFYGNRGSEILTEESAVGADFLARVCQDWEAEAERAQRLFGARVVLLRTGVVLSARGGALAKLLPVFKLGGGGKIGDGRQFMSWIALDDEIGAIRHALHDAAINGALNLTAPHPVTNREFTETLARVLERPALFTVPVFALRLVYGEMSEETILTSQRALPQKLTQSGYEFLYPQLEPALRHLLNR